MTTSSRRPNLNSRQTVLPFPALGSPKPTRSTTGGTFSRSGSSTSIKRARSPDHRDTLDIHPKRLKPVPPSPTKRQPSAHAQTSGQPPLTFSPKANASREREEAKRREQKRAEREAQKEEFKVKYTRAFPGWTFHIDDDVFGPEESLAKKRIEDRLTRLGANIEDFFCKEITHLITNKPLPSEELNLTNKENVSKSRHLKSPMRPPRGRTGEDVVPPPSYENNIVRKAQNFNMKIWSIAKLESVLDRCLDTSTSTTVTSNTITSTSRLPAPSLLTSASASTSLPTRTLARNLEYERLHGTTERDPREKRHNFRYFTKGSYFVLVEDLWQEMATINAIEYPVHKRKEDGREEGAWPVLYCHPKARSPFIEYDEREARRVARNERQEKERDEERKRRIAKVKERERQMKRDESIRLREEEAVRAKAREEKEREKEMMAKGSDLRRTMSMVQLRKRASLGAPGESGIHGLGFGAEDGDVDLMESANASGYIGSGAYMAASGNSVAITSTVGTTSTAGGMSHGSGLGRNTALLHPSLRKGIQQHVVTSRKVNPGAEDQPGGVRKGTMGPPEAIPERKMLRKSKSTNTLKLPKREEGSKPGYCECCKAKFTDFADHIVSRKHRKFAQDDNNFLQLDEALSRVRRQTRAEVAASEADALFSPPYEEEDAYAYEDEDEDNSSGHSAAPDSQEVSPIVVSLDEEMDNEEVEKVMEYEKGHGQGHHVRSSEEVADYLPIGRGLEDEEEEEEQEVVDIEVDGEEEEVEVVGDEEDVEVAGTEEAEEQQQQQQQNMINLDSDDSDDEWM